MGAGNQVGIELLYRAASLCSLATQFQTRFLESIPRPLWDLSYRHLRRAGTSNRVVVPARQAGNRFLGSLKGLQIQAQFGASTFRQHKKFFFFVLEEVRAYGTYFTAPLNFRSTVPR